MTRTIKAKAITQENFAPYGSFTSIADPQGFYFAGEIHKFYPDRVIFPFPDSIAISPLVVEKPETILITQMEMHNSTQEGMLCLDADVVMHVAPPVPNMPNTEDAEAFLIPKGTFVQIKTGVWHLAAIPVDKKTAHIMIILPERIYANDCTVVDLPKRDQFIIEV